MSEYKVSYRYATSLLDTVLEKNILSDVAKDVELVYSTLKSSHQLVTALSSPVIKPNIKLAILTDLFGSKVNSETLNFLKFVVEKNRENLLKSISQIFLDLRDVKLGIVNVNVRSAVDFTAEQTEQFKINLEKYLKKKVRLHFSIDQSIIGGFIAQIGDTVFDASLKHQLELLRKQFLKGSASLN